MASQPFFKMSGKWSWLSGTSHLLNSLIGWSSINFRLNIAPIPAWACLTNPIVFHHFFIWWFPKTGVPPAIIHVCLGFSLTYTSSWGSPMTSWKAILNILIGLSTIFPCKQWILGWKPMIFGMPYLCRVTQWSSSQPLTSKAGADQKCRRCVEWTSRNSAQMAPFKF